MKKVVILASCWGMLATGVGFEARAAVSPLEIVGYARLLAGAAGLVFGSTTVVPAAALNSWRDVSWGYYRNVPYFHGRYINRSTVTGAYFYQNQWMDADGTLHTSTEPFELDHLRRYNYRCDRSADGVKFVFNEVEDFDVAAWAASVSMTGIFHPNAPWTEWLTSRATDLDPTCGSSTFVPVTQDVTSGVPIYASGTSLVRFWKVNADYAWPPQLEVSPRLGM